MLKKRDSQNRTRRGAAAVEMAMVLPLFLMVIWAILEFGRAVMVCQMLTNAARFGTRSAILDGSTNSAIVSSVKSTLESTLGHVAPEDIEVLIQVTPAPGRPDAGDQLSQARTNDVCSLEVRVPYEQVAFVAARFLNGTKLHGECVMRHE